ncbi:class F sortase [Spirilliplanes yamanashiensis]|uniref:class F sortase n=1 Tax=Spirilliplanes yamanashiensis TaxID=42233 RepID=UPI001951752D|nr:class F sortase [Spirilliplanes yamanashiensis]
MVRPLLAVAAGAALLLGGGVAACQAQPPGDVGADRAAALASPSLPVPPSDTVPATRVPVQRGELPTAGDTVEPRRLRIPALRLDASVVGVGIDRRSGDFAVPPSVDRVGWYRWGPGLEATAGSVVIAGHVDSAEQGRGAFFRLRELDDGDTVTVAGADGRERAYRVVARQTFDKRRIPLEKFFARDGATRLTLITCGGPFDPKTGHYRDNVVVTAEPA